MTSSRPPADITLLLRDLRRPTASADHDAAIARLFDTLQSELRVLAAGLMRQERPEHTLQPTALVNEVFLKLVGDQPLTWESRAHFFGTAARAMRQVLVDHARAKAAAKRGGDWARVSLSESLGFPDDREIEVIELHEALESLANEDPRAAQVVELWFFGGLEQKEIAHVLDVSDRTVRNDWTFARLWLARELGASSE